MEILALVPGLIAAYIAFTKSPQRAFLDVYIPVLFFLPEYYRWIAPGLPDPTFSQAAVIPITVLFLLRYGPQWKFSFTDGFVFGFAFCVGYSEYLNAGYSEAQNLMFDMLSWVVLPYILAKGIIEPHGYRIEFARRFVFVVFVISIISLYEFKMGMTPFQLILGKFFPWQGLGWVTTFRYGVTRIAGPYGHAILAGVVIMAAIIVQYWLHTSGHWEPDFKKFKVRSLSKSQIILLGVIGGSVMTMCRGPWIGGVLAFGAIAIGKAKNRKRASLLVLAALIVIGIPLGMMAWSYASVGRENALTESQETAAYRKELIDKYVDIALERSVWGWGRNTWPKIPGMPSIDNYYLLLALMHGLVALACLALIIVTLCVRLYWHEMRKPRAEPPGSSLGFALIAVFLSIAVSIATVYMGGQVIPLFFLMTGWAEGYLLNPKSTQGMSLTTTTPQIQSGYKFRRVLF